ncbi:MAG: phage tail tape measure protein [Bacteroidota bacterium]|nr:phage tail tape measure protein [Bacteroidota bacterium]
MGNLKIVAEIDNKIHQQAQQIDQDLQKIAKQAANSGSVMDNAFGKVGNTLDKMGINIPSLIGPAGALAAAFKFKQLADEALEFEKAFGMAMREVQTISKAVQDDFEGISQKIVDMAANGPDDAIKLAKSYYQIVSAGHDGAAGLELLSIASKAAVAGVTDTLTAADGLTTVINAWGLSSDKANFVADIMFKTVERGKTTFSQLASNIAQVAPLAAANNIEFEQIFAALQTITKQGTPTAQAMTQIRSSIVNMTAVLGDGWSKTMTYQDGLNKVREMAGGSQIELKKLIPDVEGVSAVLALTGDKAKGAAEDLNETAKAAGAMETAYGRMMEEANNKWSIVHNKWTREIRELGKAMKDESGNMANFIDALLSNGADVNTILR